MKKRGYDAERELVHRLREAGFDALRVPVSTPSRELLPDVFAVKDDAILAFEVKSQERYAYYKRPQVEKLHEFPKIHRIYPGGWPSSRRSSSTKGGPSPSPRNRATTL